MPHMFLSYASPDSRNQTLETCPLSSPHRPSQRRKSSATPHLFLPYAGRKSSVEFENNCKAYMQEQDLPEFHATVVAKAMCIASAETAGGKGFDATLRHSLHASFFSKAIRGQHETLPEVSDDDTPDLLSEPDESSSWETDFLKDQVKRQQEELEFLRSALRHLVSLPVQQENAPQVQHESRNPLEVYETTTRQNRDIVGRLPSIIEFPARDEVDDDDSEQMSELQSPSVIVLGNPSSNLKLLRQNTPKAENSDPTNAITTLALQNKLALLKQNDPHRPSPPVCIPASTIDFSKDQVSGNAGYMKSMQLVVETRTKQKQKSYTYTDMVKGEILDGRARGLNFRLYFEQRGVYVEGLYSGTIKNGLPHGIGVLRFNNRDLYMGSFAEGKMHGEGTLLSRCDSRLATFRGTFRNNEFVEQSATAKPLSSNESASAGAA